MKLSTRDASRVLGNGYWVSPDNKVFSLPKGMSHLQWISSHEDLVRKFDSNLKQNDPDIFEKAFYKGWVRIRIEFDETDMSKLIASISAMDVDLISTLPEELKDMIATTFSLEFIDMSSGNVQHYNKEQLLQKLHRQRIASFLPINLILASLK